MTQLEIKDSIQKKCDAIKARLEELGMPEIVRF